LVTIVRQMIEAGLRLRQAIVGGGDAIRPRAAW
jgi:hypothetical protein